MHHTYLATLAWDNAKEWPLFSYDTGFSHDLVMFQPFRPFQSDDRITNSNAEGSWSPRSSFSRPTSSSPMTTDQFGSISDQFGSIRITHKGEEEEELTAPDHRHRYHKLQVVQQDQDLLFKLHPWSYIDVDPWKVLPYGCSELFVRGIFSLGWCGKVLYRCAIWILILLDHPTVHRLPSIHQVWE